ncbi:biotin--acetyl-CoA-carboxylase ligase [Mycobacterium sp. IS-1742]|uniref:biotin--[acetyl-CoA-carboxylase] ligase n=1 Tax=Mycobacterium sp. IS-1742 TaxID=1772285 RepID=UPI00073FDEEA|nr:biotin--[acetyl-CoA-carboxylase] ligase [Mycobacterium sp. IS-1742]KUI23817.1 biotin--acetyl-CoA-carboxylase ligase [Mycobacterium sp. IS-1742]
MDIESARPPLDVGILRASLGAGWRTVDVVDETGSTNADLLARAAAGEDVAGSVLLTEYQSAGRGRHGRQWTAPPRSQVAMSVAVEAGGVPPDAWGWLPLLTGVAVRDAVAEVSGVDAGLKWPNDVLVGEGKLAGILAEVAAPQQVVIVGIGLNVTLSAAEAPDPRATSLAMLGARNHDRTALAAAILRHLGDRIARWRRAGGADPTLVADYRRHSLTLGRQVTATLPGDRRLTGTAGDIDGLGRLTLAIGGDSVTVAAGDITHLRPSPDAHGG